MKDKLRRAVFLDRDGVINRTHIQSGKPVAPRTIMDFRLYPGAAEGIRRLKKIGFIVVVVTNQPDIGNGTVEAGIVAKMHDRLRRCAPVHDVKVCPHSQGAGCICRKPKPGLLLEAATDWGIDLRRSYMVGDRQSDVVAGRSVGCYTVFVSRRYAEPQPVAPDFRVWSLSEAVRAITVNERLCKRRDRSA